MALTAVCKPTHWRFLQHSKRPFTTTQQSWGRWRPAPLQQQGAAARLAVTKSSLFTEAWGTNSPEELQTLATTVSSNLFAFSIIPYAGFLYYLTKSKAAPPLMLFGWYFLLAFVAVSIPAGIYAKVHYGETLANVDWLHGGAELLLTCTNLFIVLGTRQAIRRIQAEPSDQQASEPERSAVVAEEAYQAKD